MKAINTIDEQKHNYTADAVSLYQGCFRRNVTVVTIYASLGEEALCHSLNEVLSLSLSFFYFHVIPYQGTKNAFRLLFLVH